MTSPPRAPAAPGWEVLEFVGKGGMGVVWKVRRADGTLAALKVLVSKPGRMTAAEAASSFRREASASLNVEHPHLVRGLDVGTTADGRPFLAMEFVEGRTLDAVLKDGGALPEARVVALGAALAKALDYAHRLGLVHRDVKPRNVMLPPGGGVKLLDMGLVTETGGDDGGRAFGTFGFAAPEIVVGGDSGPRSDLFSLGATLASAATGVTPDRERGFADRALPAEVDGKSLSPGLRAVLERLLKSDPAARYGSAAEVVLDLDALAAGDRPLGAILGSSAARAIRRGPRVAAVLAAVAIATGVVVWFASRPNEAPRADAAGATVARPPEPAPVDPKLETAQVFIARFPDDFVNGRKLIDEADTPSLTTDERSRLDALRSEWQNRFEQAGATKLRELTDESDEAFRAGDQARAHDVLAAWPEALRGSPFEKLAVERADVRLESARTAARLLASRARQVVDEFSTDAVVAEAAARDLIPRLDAALARTPFPGDERDSIAKERSRLSGLLAAEAKRTADDRARGRAETAWREAVAEQVSQPSAARFNAALTAAAADSMPVRTRAAAGRVVAAWDRAEATLSARVAPLKGKPWYGPRGAALFTGTVADPPSPEEVFLSPWWSASGGRVEALVAAAGDKNDAAAWFIARGLMDDALEASGPGSDVAVLFADAPHAPRPSAAAPTTRGFDVALALRDVGNRVEGASRGDAAIDAWSAVVDGKPRPASSSPSRNPAKAAGRDAFLRDDLATAAASLADAMESDPWDAEIAALRGRVLLVGARTLPTAPALLVAFSEARRAWDLDPSLSAGPLLAAEVGIELVDVAGPELARRVRPIAAAACDASSKLGRDDARMLAFSGEWRLDSGRADDAVALLRRASAKASNSGPIALALARAEHAAGHDDKAREALRRACELFGAAPPAAADELSRALAK